MKAVEKEFKRFHNTQANRFSSNAYDHYNEKKAIQLLKYIIILFPLIQLPRLQSAWGILPGTNHYAFTITIRFKVKENMAELYCKPG